VVDHLAAPAASSLAVLDRPQAETLNERRVRRQRSTALIDPPPQCELEYALQAHVACDTCRSTPRVGSKRPRRRARDRDPGERRTEDLEKTRDRPLGQIKEQSVIFRDKEAFFGFVQPFSCRAMY